MGVLRDSEGFWGAPTATLDWCETNYEVTYYIAEFWNTLSNLLMILPPFWSIFMAYREGFERRYMLCYLFLGFVGIGSWCFHMTLIYEMQLLDEIPMVWGTLVLLYVLVPMVYPSLDGSFKFKASLFLYGFVETTCYLYFKEPLIHQLAYAFLMTVALYLDVCILRRVHCDRSLFWVSVTFYYTGFAVWNIDNIYCAQLAQLRDTLPFILHPFTQLHAMWHCLAGYGSYVNIAFCIQTRALTKEKKCLTWKWSWLTLQLIPDITQKAL